MTNKPDRCQRPGCAAWLTDEDKRREKGFDLCRPHFNTSDQGDPHARNEDKMRFRGLGDIR